MTSALAFSIVKYAGAVYLLYLGIREMMSKPPEPQLPKVKSGGALNSFFSTTKLQKFLIQRQRCFSWLFCLNLFITNEVKSPCSF
ncbi:MULTISPECIES: hypothetical protein [Bacillaceae]|uniref:hypothetical protein n=1 Tax=Bacillaceae TaxID=186817 RepID=UPI0035712CC0